MSAAHNLVLTPAELQAIEDHKYFMSSQLGHEVTIDEAIDDFVRRYKADWQRERMRRDAYDQIAEIERHKYLRSQAEGRDIGRARAAEEWCSKYAGIWRRERESLERNGFVARDVVVTNPNGIHVRPTSALAEISRRYDADVYLHKDGMEIYNFLLGDKPYMNVRSVLGLLSLDVRFRDRVSLLATGRQASEALDAIAQAINDSKS
ncbi:MAG: HPr family phosphocarrier protein [Verrucomicrobia bacterium]|nr:HPr family phosphocarrier protein [Verrucomicrobiota bacterium]